MKHKSVTIKSLNCVEHHDVMGLPFICYTIFHTINNSVAENRYLFLENRTMLQRGFQLKTFFRRFISICVALMIKKKKTCVYNVYVFIILGTEPHEKWIRFTLFCVQLLPSDNADSAKCLSQILMMQSMCFTYAYVLLTIKGKLQ